MNSNIHIAKELIKLARHLVALKSGPNRNTEKLFSRIKNTFSQRGVEVKGDEDGTDIVINYSKTFQKKNEYGTLEQRDASFSGQIFGTKSILNPSESTYIMELTEDNQEIPDGGHGFTESFSDMTEDEVIAKIREYIQIAKPNAMKRIDQGLGLI